MKRHPLHTLAYLIAFTLIVATASCGGGGDGGSDGSTSKSTPPSFDGIALVSSPDADRLELHWVVATDNLTQSSEIKYNVYVGTESTVAALKAATNLQATVTNTTTHTVTGLTSATIYYALVVAEDGDGNLNADPVIVPVTTQATAVSLAATPVEINDANAVLTAPDAYAISGPEVSSLQAGKVLVIDSATGSSSLKKVVSVTPNGDSVNITTTDASLNELIDEGELSAAFMLVDPSLATTSSMTPPTLKEGYVIRRYDSPDGAFSVTSTTPEETPDVTAAAFTSYRYSTYLLGSASDSQAVRLGYTVNFIPRLDTRVKYTSGIITDRLESAYIAATGNFNVNALLGYYLNSSYDDTLTKTLMTRTFTFNYLVGSVPVTQEVEFNVLSELKLNASSSVSIESALTASKNITFGFEWTRNGGWEAVNAEGFTQSTTFEIIANGDVMAILRIYPEIKTNFYQATESSVALIPAIRLDAAAQTSPRLELTQFTAGFWAYLTLSAKLDVLDYNLPPWDLLEEPVVPYADFFSLPTASISCGSNSMVVGDSDTCTLTVTDGVNNAVPKDNINWSASPSGCSTIALSVDRKTATVTAAAEGSCEIVASVYGSGVLSTAGMRYASSSYTIAPVSLSTTATIPAGSSFIISTGAITSGWCAGDLVFDSFGLFHCGGTFDVNGQGPHGIGRVAVNSTLEAVTSCPTVYSSGEWPRTNIATGNVFCARSATSGNYMQFRVTSISQNGISFEYITSSSSSF
ncbi:hypothetical protein ACFL6N_02635 [Thermodesulfobacteriota bacterium]